MVVAVPELPLRSPTIKLSSLPVSVCAQSEGLGVIGVTEIAVVDVLIGLTIADVVLEDVGKKLFVKTDVLCLSSLGLTI